MKDEAIEAGRRLLKGWLPGPSTMGVLDGQFRVISLRFRCHLVGGLRKPGTTNRACCTGLQQ
jgi:hypothetical protein